MATEGKRTAIRVNEGRYRLDVRGLVCPYPQILVARSLQNIQPGDVLDVILDNPPSVRDIPRALEERSYRVEVSRPDSATWLLHIRAK